MSSHVYRLVLVRHGESEWNHANRFTGWTDVDLSERGVNEAIEAGQRLREAGFVFDVVYTSVLKRAIRTVWHILDALDLMWIPVHRSWRLNERHYGALQGLNKKEMAQKVGEEQVHLWRRSYAIRPPALEADDARHPRFDPRYAELSTDELPASESLKDTLNRVLPYWNNVIVPDLAEGRRVLVVAHGNSLRALVRHIDRISDEEIQQLNIPLGVPLVYELDSHMNPVSSSYLA